MCYSCSGTLLPTHYFHPRWLKDKVDLIQTQPTIYDVTAVNLSALVVILHCTEMANYNTFNLGLNAAKKYASHPKTFQIKVIRNWILYKEVRERICLPPPRVERGGIETLIWLKYNIVLKWQNTFNLELNVPENTYPMKKSCK